MPVVDSGQVGMVPPSSMTFMAGERPAVTLHSDGRVEIHDGMTADAAAHAFWVAVHQFNPAEQTIASLRSERDKLKAERDRHSTTAFGWENCRQHASPAPPLPPPPGRREMDDEPF